MQKRHLDRNQYFREQAATTKKYVIPYAEKMNFGSETRVLEIGCGQGGNLEPFLELGCEVVGIDMREHSIKVGQKLFESDENASKIELICADIYDLTEEDLGEFDFIFMKDVIEHIHDQERFMQFVKRFLKPKGQFFLAFPPWQMPFGGHQQICRNKFVSKLPYYHLLPVPLYKLILKSFKETPIIVEDLLEIKETGISIERFEKILKKENYHIDRKTIWFINPNYDVKFGMKPRKQLGVVSSIPWFRNFVSTCAYYLISKN